MNEQAVSETDESVTQTAEAETAQDLDSILNEYESAQETPQQQAEPDVKSLAERLSAFEQKQAAEQTQKDINNAITTVKDGLDAPIPDEIIEGLLYAKADKNAKFRQAWNERHTNPTGFNKVLKAVQADLKKQFSSLPDKGVNEDREALASAVRGSKSTTVETQDFDGKKIANMSDREFRKSLRDMGL